MCKSVNTYKLFAKRKFWRLHPWLGDIKMQSSKQNISKTIIETEIYNTFELFNKEKNICIADFIEKLDISTIKHQEYRKIKFSYESLIKFILYQRLKKFKFITQTRQYLKNHPDETILLGFKELPNRRQVGYFKQHILDKETKELLERNNKSALWMLAKPFVYVGGIAAGAATIGTGGAALFGAAALGGLGLGKYTSKFFKEMQTLNKSMEEILYNKMKESNKDITMKKLKTLLDRDTYLSAQEAKQWGLIDYIAGDSIKINGKSVKPFTK